ncbi:hypothetical protein [Desulfatitalea alkaliphila]|uniref:Uncharacterized protein n=1 Tax=Desulfatitalea alkaliphila TaxID=2929485 RepID=A0AA41R659_9BACT|nr:hypothetical protein [Desulfatitalea alkaliphila]MCJ8501820.1 hypothetical protein [Desulfatitalea alkaliphila]
MVGPRRETQIGAARDASRLQAAERTNRCLRAPLLIPGVEKRFAEMKIPIYKMVEKGSIGKIINPADERAVIGIQSVVRNNPPAH